MKNSLLKEKRNRLAFVLKELDSLMVAFSGGVDSTFLLAVASETVKGNLVAVTAASRVHPQREKAYAIEMAERLGVQHIVLESREMKQADFTANPVDRCYICKKYLFKDLMKLASRMGIKHLAHGANQDDLNDFRPGFAAANEMKILAPLVDAGLTKADIRLLSKAMNLETWNKPSLACLATRIPYGTPLTEKKLAMVDQAEEAILELGFNSCRVRLHDTVARIEILPRDLEKIVDQTTRATLIHKLKDIGFSYICVDLEGYVQGSMNRPVAPDFRSLRMSK
jgi:uncharacterized protein